MDFKKSKEIKTFDLAKLIFLLMVVFAVSVIIIFQEIKDVDKSLALHDAENLAFQLVSGSFNAPKNSNSRIPASMTKVGGKFHTPLGVFDKEGEIGKDPWGKAYMYRVIEPLHKGDRSKGRDMSYLVVWSSGPNLKKETDLNDLSDSRMEINSLTFSGDDFGYVKEIPDMSHGETKAE